MRQLTRRLWPALVLLAQAGVHGVKLSEGLGGTRSDATRDATTISLGLQRQLYPHTTGGCIPRTRETSLVISITTSVLNCAEARDTIRQTWASDLPAGVRVVFLGCRPDLSEYNASEQQYATKRTQREREAFQDLLIDELIGCVDSYSQLVHKVMAFFQWSGMLNESPQAKAYVMVADDDVYLRVPALVDLVRQPTIPSERFYGGQVWATQYNRSIHPRRHPKPHKYYLSWDDYALDDLPPFANGPHYLLSADVASFHERHRHVFRGVGGLKKTGGTLDDVSTAIWLLAMQIHPRHLPEFSNLRDTHCRNGVVSFADLSVEALHALHANVLANRSFCAGFS